MPKREENGSLIEALRRLPSLRKLLWAEQRLTALETKAERLTRRTQNISNVREQQGRLRERNDILEEKMDGVQRRASVVEKQVNGLQRRGSALENQTVRRLNHIIDQVDVLKSSLEVPQELVDEFFEWKRANPVPENPLVSVVVATYNRTELLMSRCIPSILNQTYPNLELIVVGDGCTDGTAEAVTGIDDPRVRFVNLTDRGAYPEDPERMWMVAGTPAMNEGLALARGDFITHLDDDDEHVPTRLQELTTFAVENGCDFVWHPYWWENREGAWRLNQASDLTHTQVTTSSVFYRSWFKRIPWDIEAYRLMEPGDWNRFRKIKYIGPAYMRYPEPLLNHYRQRQRM